MALLDPTTSRQCQAAAAKLAAMKGHARVHLDTVWWGDRSGFPREQSNAFNEQGLTAQVAHQMADRLPECV